MSGKTIIHPELGQIVVSRSMRARRISIRVSRRGDVTLVCPCLADIEEAFAFLERKLQWVRDCVERARSRCETESRYSKEEMDGMKREASGFFPERVRYLAARFGFSFRSVRIGVAYSKWGSCSSDNVIMISAVAVILPPHLRDYLILHELCHTVHHNHSDRFHALLDRCCGGLEREYRRELGRYRTRRTNG